MPSPRTWPTSLVCLLLLWAGAGRPAVAQSPQPTLADDVLRPADTDPDAAIRKSKPFRRWWEAFHRRGRHDPLTASRARAGAYEVFARESARQPLGALTWESLGPRPIVGFPTSSGRVSAVAVDPANPSHWLIGGAQGGVWSTTDAGATWVPRTDAAESLAMGAIAFAPGNPAVVYAGTGEAHFSGDSYGGAGLLKSTDGGDTWALRAAGTFRASAFSEIRVDPLSADTAVAAVTYAIAGEYGSYPPNLPPRGIFRTTDGGSNWSLTLSAVEATDVEASPDTFSRLYAGVKYRNSFAEPGGVFRSFDGGQSWSFINGPWPANLVGRVEIAIAPSNPNRVFVSIDNFNLLGVWRTDDAWSASPTWTPLGVPGPCPNSQFWYDHDVAVDPQDADRLYHGGISLCRHNGTAWQNVSGAIHVDQQTMAWAGNRLIVGNDGGVFSTTDGGASWSNHNANLVLTQFYDGVLHPTSPSFALGGTQDNGTGKWTGAPGWPQVFGADGGDCEIAGSNPDTHWAVTTQVLGVYRTRTGGGAFEFAGSGLAGTSPFIGRLVKCPASDDVMLAGTNPLQRSNNFFGAPPPTWGVNAPPFSGSVYSLEFAPSDAACGTYVAGTDFPTLMLTTDGGASWRNIRPTTMPNSKYPMDLAFDPTDPNVLYVALSGFDSPFDPPGHLFKTTNALSPTPTFAAVGPPVDVPHNAVVVDPAQTSVVYVGTDVGVWRSTNAGGSWTPLPGLPNVAVFDLQVNAATGSLVAFTHGRGAWRLPLALVSLAETASTVTEAAPWAAIVARVERSDGAALPQPVTVSYATEAGSAQPGSDFVATSGVLTFPAGTPSGGSAIVFVPLIDDPSDEPDETFTVRLSAPSGALLDPAAAHVVTIADNDPPPTVSAHDTGLVEGNTGSTTAPVTVALSSASAFPVRVVYATEDGTATAGADYTAATGTLTFPAGVRELTVPVTVVSDLLPEPDETFSLRLEAPVNATLGDDIAQATIVDDDGPSLSTRALLRGSRLVDDLSAATGPQPGEDLFHLVQAPQSSYEVVVDGASGDVQPVSLARLAGDGVTVLQSAAATGTGGSWSLRWENTLSQPLDVQYARVRSGDCATGCGPDDQYRVRMSETTLVGPRFNNGGGQATVMIVQNVTHDPVAGHQYFWSGAGALLAVRPFSLAPHETGVLSLPTVPGLPGAAGSVTVTHDGPRGALAGKLVAVEPASGFSFDTPLSARP